MGGRKPWLDREAILQQTMELFWQNGYEATSITDIVGHLGMHGTSIYRLFGNKHDLYIESLRYYRQQRLGELKAKLRTQHTPAGIADVLHEWGSRVSDGQGRGCFMVNAAVERIPGDDKAAAEVAWFWHQVERELTDVLECAREEGTLAPGKNPMSLARFIMAVMHGMSITGKVDSDPTIVRGIAASAIGAIQ